jgi:Gpi18-like mannosyltransferase
MDITTANISTPSSAVFNRLQDTYYRRSFNLYFIGILICNFSLLFMKSYEADLGFWQHWINQLSTNGYDKFDGNYPPIYIHWLYLVGEIYGLLGLPLEKDTLFKFLTQIPVVLCHCLLLYVVYTQLKNHQLSKNFFHSIMAIVAFNPALLINGPIWGQVDLIPVTFVFISLLCCFEKKWAIWAAPFFILSLLTKFQMIAFLPVYGFLFWRDIKKHSIGLAISAFLIALAFLPYILSNHFVDAINQAYINTLGQYPKTTFNAANIWILLTANVAPDNVMLFGATGSSMLGKIFMAKYFGILCFAIVSLLVFSFGIYRFYFSKESHSETSDKAYVFFASFICALGFFALLPAMHERYMFPAVVMALGLACFKRGQLFYPLLASVFCSINMLIIVAINGSDVWTLLSSFTMILLAIGLVFHFSPKYSATLLLSNGASLFKYKQIPLLAIFFSLSWMFYYFIDTLRIHSYELKNNEVFLTSLPIIQKTQTHGVMRIDKSHDNNVLQINNRRYKQGIGTHTNSDIHFNLPPNAHSLSFTYGTDDEVGHADMQFSVWGDGRLLWKSPILQGFEKTPKRVNVDVKGVAVLALKVDKVTSDRWDHADWISPVIKLEAAK